MVGWDGGGRWAAGGELYLQMDCLERLRMYESKKC